MALEDFIEAGDFEALVFRRHVFVDMIPNDLRRFRSPNRLASGIGHRTDGADRAGVGKQLDDALSAHALTAD